MKEAIVLVLGSYHRSDLPLFNIKVSWAYVYFSWRYYGCRKGCKTEILDVGMVTMATIDLPNYCQMISPVKLHSMAPTEELVIRKTRYSRYHNTLMRTKGSARSRGIDANVSSVF